MNDPKDCHYTFLQHSVCLNSSKSQINFKPCMVLEEGEDEFVLNHFSSLISHQC